MKKIIILFVFLLINFSLLAQTNEKKEFLEYKSYLDSINPLRYRALEFSLFISSLGGSLSPTIGETIKGDEVKIDVGGGFGYGLNMNIYLVPFLKLYTSFSYSKGDLNINVQGVDGTFSKFPFKIGLLTQLKLGKFCDSIVLFHFGPGVSYYMNPTLNEKWVDENIRLNYRNAMGAEIMGGFSFVSIDYPRLFYYIEFHYHKVKYKFYDGNYNDLLLVPGNTKIQWRELDGSGFGTFVGFGVRI